jgi:hypothetical protein
MSFDAVDIADGQLGKCFSDCYICDISFVDSCLRNSSLLSGKAPVTAEEVPEGRLQSIANSVHYGAITIPTQGNAYERRRGDRFGPLHVRFGSLAATRPNQKRGCFTPESCRGSR